MQDEKVTRDIGFPSKQHLLPEPYHLRLSIKLNKTFLTICSQYLLCNLKALARESEVDICNDSFLQFQRFSSIWIELDGRSIPWIHVTTDLATSS